MDRRTTAHDNTELSGVVAIDLDAEHSPPPVVWRAREGESSPPLTLSVRGRVVFAPVGHGISALAGIERATEMVQRCKEEGKPIGRPKKPDADELDHVYEWREKGLNYGEIATLASEIFGTDVTCQTIHSSARTVPMRKWYWTAELPTWSILGPLASARRYGMYCIFLLIEERESTMSRQKAVLVGILLILTVGCTAPGLARAPPQAACGICTDALDQAAADQGVTLTRGQSKLVIQVYENTSTRWTATVQLSDGASALRNDSLRRAVVSNVFDRARMVAEPTHVTSHLSGQTLTVSYRDPGAAETHDDTIVFTRFHATEPQSPFVMGGEGTPYPGADTVVLRAPNGYTVTGDYASATGSDAAVRWHGNRTTEHIDRSTRVTFIDDQSPQSDSNDATLMAELNDVWSSMYRTLIAALCMVFIAGILFVYLYRLTQD